jgi:hypothetical protein
MSKFYLSKEKGPGTAVKVPLKNPPKQGSGACSETHISKGRVPVHDLKTGAMRLVSTLINLD